jgi:hypothetical protein
MPIRWTTLHTREIKQKTKLSQVVIKDALYYNGPKNTNNYFFVFSGPLC